MRVVGNFLDVDLLDCDCHSVFWEMCNRPLGMKYLIVILKYVGQWCRFITILYSPNILCQRFELE